MKILVTGGAGYIGSVLVPRLLEHSYDVDVIDLLWYGNHLPKSVKVSSQDLFSLKKQDLEAYEQIIFLAGISNDPMADTSPAKSFIWNAAAPAYVAYTARLAGVKRFIFASSCSVYGYATDQLRTEEDPILAEFPYGISKIEGEQAILRLVNRDFSVISLRKGTVCGYSPRMRLDLIVNAMFRSAISTGIITVASKIWRPILSIRDAATAYVRATEADYSVSGVFNISSMNYSSSEVADIVRETLIQEKGINAKLVFKNIPDLRSYKTSAQKARDVLSFHPKDTVRDIVLGLIENQEKFSDWENPNYSNIETFKRLEARHDL